MLKTLQNRIELNRMKLSVMLFLTLILTFAMAATAWADDTVITMQIGSPNITINGATRFIDAEGTTPATINGRTMLPLRAIAEALGLTVDWDGATQTVTLRSADNTNTDSQQPEEQAPAQPEAGGKILVAYFSATNNTENVANHIAAALDADLYEITPETPYTSADLDYGNDNSRSSLEMNDPASRPAISGSVENVADYDIVFIGYPIWWGQAPKIICTFMESYDFSGKTIVPFCTSSSSGIGSSATNLHSLAADAAWLEGQRFSGSATQTEVVNWVNSLNLTATGR